MLKDKFGFNFWPSFTDLMLSLVLVVLIILFVVSKMIAAGTENLDKARESQKKIQNQIESQIGKNYSIGRLQVQIEQDLSSNYISGIHLIKKSVEQFIRSVVA